MQEEVMQGYRLSPQQRRLWLLQQQEQNSPYRAQCFVLIEGILDRDRLTSALREVVNRHEILHTTFQRQTADSLPRQVIVDPHIDIDPYLDLSDSPSIEQEQRIEELRERAKQLPFNFEHGPLAHASPLILSPVKHLLIVTLSALCSDIHTLNNFTHELTTSYAGRLQEESIQDEPTQYVELSEWQNELLEQPATEIGRQYWLQKDYSALCTARLPFARAPEEVKTGFRPALFKLAFAAPLAKQIGAVGESVTSDTLAGSTFLLACWQTLLWRLSSYTKIIVGMACDGRQFAELKGAFGLFTRFLPVESNLTEHLRFDELIKQLDATTKASFKRQEYFSWELIEETTGEHAGGLGFFPFAFEYSAGTEKHRAREADFTIRKQYAYTERFGIRLSCIESDEELLAEFHYDSNLYGAAEIECLAAIFRKSILAALNNKEIELGELVVANEDEQKQLRLEPLKNKDYQSGDKHLSQPDKHPHEEVESASSQGESGIIRRANREQALPLSFAQQRLWFIHQLDPLSAVYNIPAAVQLHGLFHRPAFQSALDAVLRRHESLRTSFSHADGLPFQLISPQRRCPMLFSDLSELPAEERLTAARRIASTDAAQPFDLSEVPLLRVHLLRLQEEEHIVLLVMHHIISDGWSMSILVRELSELYDAFWRGQESPLAALPIQYADYAVWQREQVSAAVLEEELGYWRNQLGGELPILELPTDYARPPLQSHRGAQYLLRLPLELSRELQALSRREGVTMFMLLLAAFKVLLYRYTGQSDIIVGTPVTNRDRVELEPLIGFFVNTLVLRTDLSGNPSFEELLGRLRETTLGAFAHQHVPFETLVERLHPHRSLSHSPLFQLSFSFDPASSSAASALSLSALSLSALPSELRISKFDLTLNCSDSLSGLLASFEYNTDLFDRSTIERMGTHLQSLLLAICADPERSLSRLPLFDADERTLLVRARNRTQRHYSEAELKPLHQLFEQTVERRGEAVALISDTAQLSYRELNERANRVARWLRERGVGSEVRVGVCVERSVEMVVGLLGVLKAGGCYVPLDAAYPQERLSFILRDAAPLIILTQKHLVGALPECGASVLCLDSDWHILAQHGTDNLSVNVTVDNLVYVIYTSGSTGRPKGAMNIHRGVCNRQLWMQETYPLSDEDRVLQLSSFSFDFSFWEILAPLCAGACLVLPEPGGHRDSRYLLELIVGQRISIVHFVPSMLQAFLSQEGVERCESLRHVFCGGEELPVSLVERFFARLGAELHNQYGPTETSIDVTYWNCERGSKRRSIPIGKPNANNRIYLLDDALQPVAIGMTGELHIGGVAVGRGYLNRPELTAERFIPDPFSLTAGARLYSTGDLARFLSDGNIEYLGRIDHQVKLRGFRIEPGEIEAALTEHPSVREALVLLREETAGDKRLVGYVVAETEQAPVAGELREYLKSKLPDYMIPAAWVVLAEMPLTPNGKVDRKALLDATPSVVEAASRYVAPRTPVEEVLAGVWADVLSLERVGVHDNFFDLGGHSLLATQFVSRIQRALQVEVALRLIFEKPTVAELAQSLEATMHGEPRPDVKPIERANREQALPLSFAQQRLWFIHQLDPSSAAYNIPAAVLLRGLFRPHAFHSALRHLLARHESLRTSFSHSDGLPAQLISPLLPLPLRFSDLSQLPAEVRPSEAHRIASDQARQPFDLSLSPLLRVHLLRLQEDEHILVLVMHHIISDGWSMGILVRELSVLYDAYCRGQESPLLSLPVQYADYAVWQQERLSEAVMEEQLAYWRAQLGGELPVLELPADHARPARQSHRGDQLHFSFPASLSEALRQLSRRQHVSLFMTLLAAFKVLLYRYSGLTDIIVGTPVTNRDRVELEPLIGFFVNTLVLRTDLSGNPSFEELLGRLRETTLGAFAHQDLPFERLVEELEPERNLSRSPLFQVMFILQNTPVVELEMSELSVSSYGLSSGSVQYDLTLSLAESGEGLTGVWEYDADLFEATSIAQMQGHWEELLKGVTADASARLGELRWLSKEEERLLLEEWNETSVEGDEGGDDQEYETTSRQRYPVEMLHGLFEAEVERATAQAIAVKDDFARLTYHELERRANQLANHLRRHGVGVESLVGVCLDRSVEMVVALLGILKAGAAYVPMDPTYPAARLRYMLKDAGVSVLLTEERCLASLEAAQRKGESHEEQQEPQREPAQPVVIALDLSRQLIAAESQLRPALSLSPDNLAYVIYTSGSTGQPKGAMNTHGAIANRLRWMQRAYSLDSHDSVLQKTPYSFDVSVWEFFWPLMVGATLVMARPGGHQDADYLRRVIESERITTLHFVPSMLRAFLEQSAGGDLSSLRRVICSGEALTPELVARFHESLTCTLHNLYGPTEAAVDVTHWECVRGDERRRIPIGRPIANTRIYILDREGGLVAPKVAGELHIGGAGLGRGYLKRAELTGEKFIPDRWSGEAGARLYRTGDVARYLRDGNIEYLGRIDEQVKVRGMRIELGEIEASLKEHPLVRECVAVVREERQGDARIEAYVVAVEQVGLMGSELRAWLKEHLPEYMVPSLFVVLDALPLTPSGKVDRRALLSIAGEALVSTVAYAAPRSPVEEALSGVMAEVLRAERVGIRDNFFELGGHSLLAMQVVSRVRRIFQIELPLRRIFEEPTVAGLARLIEGEIGAGRSLEATLPLKRVARATEIPLSYAQQRLWFIDQLEPGSDAYNIASAVRLNGRLNPDALEQALNEIIRRHESLRTNFLQENGRARPLIHAAARQALPLIDLSGLPEAERSATAERLATQEAQRPFNLSADRLLRVSLLRLSEEEHIVLLTMHHIISDAWSMGLLVGEVEALYPAFAEGRPSPLEELPLQYADFACWQREWLQGETLESELNYWRGQLTGASPLLSIPADHPRPSVQTYRGATASLRLPEELGNALKTLSREKGATLFMTLLAAFKTLLFRYSQQEDIVVGTPIANRNRIEIEGLIGVFVNTIVLRADLSGNPSFGQLLERVREVCLGAYAHQELPFEKLLDELQPERDLSHTPLFQVMFTLDSATNASVSTGEAEGLRPTPLEVEHITAKFELTLAVAETARGLTATFEYNTDIFERPTVERMLEHFHILLEGVVAAPETTLSELPLLSEAEQHRLLFELGNTTLDDRSEQFTHQLFEQQAERTPDSIALVFEDERLSYGSLNAHANQLAHYLQRFGIGPEDRVGLWMEPGTEMIVALLGILKAGGVYVPLDPAYPKERLAFMLEDAGVRVLLTRRKWLASLPPHDARVVCMDRDLEMIATESADNLASHGREENLAYVIYTSGSTGQPKGVGVSHQAAAKHFVSIREEYELKPSDRVLQFASLSFDVSLEQILPPLLSGARLHLRDASLWSVQEFSNKLRDLELTVVDLPPAYLHQLLIGEAQISLERLRLLIVGGDVMEKESMRLWRKSPLCALPLINAYGPTEATITSTLFRFDAATQTDSESEPSGNVIGRPLVNRKIYILDGRGNLMPYGMPGELHIGGASLARGYLDRPALTAERFIPDPFFMGEGARLYKTGDLARYLPDGNLEFLGRLDQQVKIRGFRIEPGEVESLLTQHADVRQAIVLAREDAPGEKRLTGYVVAAEQREPSAGELHEFLKGRLPDYMIPSAWVVLEEIPLSPSGKVDRRRLPAPDRTKLELEQSYVAPRTEVEATLAGIWAQLLGLERVGVHDNFFQLGGDSILSIQIVSRANQAGLRLTPKQLFQHQTIAELTPVVETTRHAQHETPASPGAVPLTPIQQWFFEQGFVDSHHYNQAVLLEVRHAVDTAKLEQVIGRLVAQHDALQLRFKPQEGEWRQINVGVDEPVHFERVDLSSLAVDEQASAIEAAATTLQTSLDLTHGPLMRAALFDMGEGKAGRLLLVIHHLVIDGVSWRILLEDVHAGYEQLSRAGSVEFFPRTTSFKRWAERLQEHAQSEGLRRELPFWLSEERPGVKSLPRDYIGGLNTMMSTGIVSCMLSPEETRALLQDVPGTYHTEINDALLTALALALAVWTGESQWLIDLEGHGREEIAEDIDVSRTVGWFTSGFPVWLNLNEARGVGESLKAVKEQLRAIPRRGVGYGVLRYMSGDEDIAHRLRMLPQAEIIFNYFGQLDQALAESVLFEPARESAGPYQSGRQHRSHLLELNSSVAGGQLQMAWTFSEDVHRRETIEALAEGMIDALRLLIAHCRTAPQSGHTPSDFPLVPRITQRQLDEILATPGGTIKDIYPLSPVQQGMFFHSLYAGKSSVYVEQTSYVLRGELNPAALLGVWEQLLNRHHILRTSFHLGDLDEPLQAVHASAGLECKQEDLCHLSDSEQQEWLANYLEADRHSGFDPSQAPLMRLALFKRDEQSHLFIWTFHHLLLDGWSMALLFSEALRAYQSLSKNLALSLESPRPYRDYIAWLRRQNMTEAEEFWRTTLKGITRPTRLGAEQLSESFTTQPEAYADQEVRLSSATTQTLQALARSRQLTLNTIVQGAWGLLLSHYSGEEDVVFGVTVSGRPAELSGVESMIGMFINTLPLRVQVAPGESLLSWLSQLQRQQVEMRQYDYTPLVQVLGWSEMPQGASLFESLLVFENYPVAALAGDLKTNLEIVGVETLTRTKYRLTVIASLSPELSVHMAYDRRRFKASRITQMLEHLKGLLEQMAAHPSQRVSSLPRLSAEERQELPVQWSAKEESGEDSSRAQVALVTLPRTPTEEILSSIWAEVLGIEQVDVEGNFFEMGGHSLLATQLVSRVRRAFELSVPLRSLFDWPTVHSLAAYIDKEMQAGRGLDAPPVKRVSRAQPIPLSFAQQRLWIVDQLSPASGAYNLPIAIRLSGRLNVEALERTLNEIVNRHETLRTSFPLFEAEPVQMIAPRLQLKLSVVEFTNLSEAERETEVKRLATEEAERTFDLTRAPLLRTTLLRLEENLHVLLFTMHHIISDGWSMGVLISEVVTLYAAFSNGESSPLEELPVQYADFAVWQREWLQGERLEQQLEYWKQQLRNVPALALPTDKPRPTVQSFRGAEQPFRLSKTVTEALKSLGNQEDCTIFMTLLAAFQTLLHRYTRQQDIVVGTDLAGRNQPEVENLIGFFVNMLALRTDFSGNPTFRELLRRVRRTALEAYSHQDLPFEKLVAALQLERDLSRFPVFQVVLVLQNEPSHALELPGLSLSPVQSNSLAVKFDLILFLTEEAGGLSGHIDYSTDLFEAETIRRMMEHLEILIIHIVAQPDGRIDELEMFTGEEKRRKAMQEKEQQMSQRSKLLNVKRKAVDLSEVHLVKTGHLRTGEMLPLVFEPVMSNVELAKWAADNRSFIEGALFKHGALLFRGFAVRSVAEFENVASSICSELFGEYGDLPREGVSARVYGSTPYPADKSILFHNESSHMHRWPLKICFYCVQPAQQGGETPIVDCREVCRLLDPALIEQFRQKKIVYVRNFTGGIDVSWQDFFRTSDTAAVEAYCRNVGLEFEWKKNGGLRTRQLCEAVTTHPKTGEPVFFNQMQLHHIGFLDATARRALMSLFKEEDYPRHVYFGDGTPIDEPVIDAISEAYRRAALSFAWQERDILILDNMLTAHGRNPFTGSRKIVVAMGEMFERIFRRAAISET
jgi:amino acid adenylation domain-containing protein/non-ribosomal peptide synthase protein (TIGR01720 family)